MVIKQTMIFLLVLLYNLLIVIQCQNVVYVSSTSCPPKQYLSSTELVCTDCSINAIQSPNGLSCVCKPGFYFTKNGGGIQVECQACPTNQVPSADGWACISCQSGISGSSCSSCTPNTPNTVLNSADLLGNQNTATCQPCATRYSNTANINQCQLCTNFLNTNVGGNTCSCPPGKLSLTACFTKLIPTGITYTITYNSVSTPSGYLTAYMMDSLALCQSSIDAGCQSLANMCAMAGYVRTDYLGSSGGPCYVYNRADTSVNTASGKKVGFPWLFYTINQNLQNNLINHIYTKGEILQIILAAYDISGTFLGFRNATQNGDLQMCPNSIIRRNETFRVGTRYLETCSVTVSQFFNQTLYPPTFYDPYLIYTDTSGVTQLYPIPVKIGQLVSETGSQPNLQFVPGSWLFTRRLLLVDNIGSISPPYQANKTATYVTYASSMRLVVNKADTASTVSPTLDGQIYVPYLEVNMTTVSLANAGSTGSITFEVMYFNWSTITTAFQYSVSVAMGVLCALAGLYAILRSFFWCRRSGISGFEGLVLLKTLAHACASISNMFFLVIFGISLYYQLIYKNQSMFSILPPDDDTFFVAYLICAFLLKLLEIIHLFVTQCTIDIFLIDWERPKHLLAPKQVIEPSKFDHTENAGDQNTVHQEKIPLNSGVSIWRTYFIANEWNEIQTYRKTSLVFNLVVVLLFMEVIGFANITRFDQYVVYNPSSEAYKAPFYRMFRFAVIVSIFGITAFLQWLFTILIYERVIEDKLRNYVDLCSVSNVSVFILAHRQFGYYIHGRSVHGAADVSIAEMYQALQKENSGSCAKRGLESDSMQQTYIMALPNIFRNGLDSVYRPGGPRLAEDGRTMQYLEVNKFLDRFINRTNNPRITFRFQDRKFFEDIFDGEFEDNSIEGRFYRDNGTSFGNILFYGQELALITFDILLFTVVDLILQNTVLDAVITWVLVAILKMIRNGCGASNLAKKTLVDRRFLI